ncbi:hypothetical protein RF11_08700 [Thelohanellus kitauei]|uniref:Uncharacterized protein n=1 Tax=Thelohanellus kitauei TaxID=669202 RepID=A0A0C2IT16_THEKT|nr:hypothetical protein RF11_08700 [Thelohanellus kitauei]
MADVRDGRPYYLIHGDEGVVEGFTRSVGDNLYYSIMAKRNHKCLRAKHTSTLSPWSVLPPHGRRGTCKVCPRLSGRKPDLTVGERCESTQPLTSGRTGEDGFGLVVPCGSDIEIVHIGDMTKSGPSSCLQLRGKISSINREIVPITRLKR